jgi:hypothetical protein
MVTKTDSGITEGLWVNKQPTDLNYLKPNGFKFQITNSPNISYFCQAASIPQISIGYIDLENPYTKIPYPGEKLTYDDLTIKFMVQEDMSDYLEIFNWLIGLGAPEGAEQFNAWNKSQSFRFPGIQDKRGASIGNFSDADLTILDSDNKPNIIIHFRDIFPIGLQGLEFDISTGSAAHMSATATFKYTFYTIEKL